MDNWYAYATYGAAPPKPLLRQRSEQLPTQPSLRRGPGSQKSSSSSDTGSRNGDSSKSEKHRRFLFVGRRKKRRDLSETSSNSTADSSGNVSVEEVFKAIAYSECEQQSAYTIKKPSNLSRSINPRSLKLHDYEPDQRRYSDSSYQSTRTFTPEQFKVPVSSQERCSSPNTPREPLYSRTSSETSIKKVAAKSAKPTSPEIFPYPTPPPPPTEKTQPPPKDRRNLIQRPLSSGSNTLGEVEPSIPIRLEKKFPARLRINPFRIKHTRSRSDQSEAFGSWEEAIDWWYEYGEDEPGEQCPGGYI